MCDRMETAMNFDLMFFLTSIGMGVSLAMDAFSVSLANGLGEPDMSRKKAAGVAGIFAVFQGIMPLLGWICVHTLAEMFEEFEKFIPWIALILLGFIGGKMLIEGIKCSKEPECECEKKPSGIVAILIQGVATSIDALSVGFAISDYELAEALVSVLLIAAVTFAICLCGIYIGKHFGTALAGRSSVFGGIILILIGLEIFISSFF